MYNQLIEALFHISEVAEAHRHLESAPAVGKVVLTWERPQARCL